MRVDTLETPIVPRAGYDWRSLARRGRWERGGNQPELLAFLLTVSVPITFSVRLMRTLGSFAAAMCNAVSERLIPGAMTPPQ